MTSFYSRASQRTVHIKELDTDTINPTTDNYRDGKSHGSKLAIIGKPGSGKCLDPNTPVLLYDATIKRAKDVLTGDLLMGDDFTARRVLSTTSGVDEMYRITQSAGMTYVVNQPHILSLKQETTGKVVDISVKEYLKSEATDLVGFKALPPVDAKEELEIDPYQLGEWLGRRMAGQSPSISLQLSQVIEKYELAEIPHIPRPYKLGSQRAKVLLGFIKGSGAHYHIREQKYLITSEKSTQQASALGVFEDLIVICQGLGVKVKMYINAPKAVDPMFASQPCNFKASEYPPLLLDIHLPETLTLPGPSKTQSQINIEPLGKGAYCGFELDGNGRFQLQDHTVTHNTTIIKNFMYEKQHIIPIAQVVSGSEDSNHFYGNFIPDSFIFDEYSHDIFGQAVERQKLANEYQVENPYCFILWDDSTDDTKLFNHKLVQGLYKKGRHWHLLHLLSLQYSMSIKPVIRTNLDGTFILRENQLRNRKVLFDNYCTAIPDFRDFCDIMDQVTSDYTAIFINNQVSSTKFEDCVFWYKAKNEIPEDWRFGCDEYWEHHYARYDKNRVLSG